MDLQDLLPNVRQLAFLPHIRARPSPLILPY